MAITEPNMKTAQTQVLRARDERRLFKVILVHSHVLARYRSQILQIALKKGIQSSL